MPTWVCARRRRSSAPGCESTSRYRCPPPGPVNPAARAAAEPPRSRRARASDPMDCWSCRRWRCALVVRQVDGDIGLAEEHDAGAEQPIDGQRVARRMVVFSSGMPHVVGMPTTSYDSLMVMGTPCSGPPLPLARARSAGALAARALDVRGDDGVERRVVLLHPRQIEVEQLQAADLLAADLAASCLVERKGTSSIAGSSRASARPSARAGASARMALRIRSRLAFGSGSDVENWRRRCPRQRRGSAGRRRGSPPSSRGGSGPARPREAPRPRRPGDRLAPRRPTWV